MTDMIERVARAIDDAYEAWDATTSDGSGMTTALAQAAIEAMREPTVAMALDGGQVMAPAESCEIMHIGEDAAEEAWRRMIGVALGEQPARQP